MYDVVIIGAGLSGLTAAFRLLQLKPNLKIKILEAKDRVGGRLLTLELPAANNSVDVWDLGGTWIGNKSIQPFINQLLIELNLKTYPQKFEGNKILQIGKKNKHSIYDSHIPKKGLLSLYDAFTLIKHVESVQTKLFKKENQKQNSHDVELYDSITLDNFLSEKTWTQCLSDCTRAAFRACLGAEQSKVSALYCLTYINSCGGLLNLFSSNSSSGHGYRIIGGAQSICSRILEIIREDKLELQKVVTSIEEIVNMKDDRSSLVRTATGETYQAKNVIVSIPPHFVSNIHFQPALSPSKFEYFSSMMPGHLIKVILTYENAFWTEMGFSGEIVTNGGPSHTSGCTSGPLCIVFDATTNNNSPALLGLIGGNQAFEYEKKTKNERKEAVLKSLESFFNSKDVRNFIVYCEKIWRQESYVGGCPVSVLSTGVTRYLDDSLRAPEHGIHFAVSELSKQWMGFMEGAVECGEKAALEILAEI